MIYNGDCLDILPTLPDASIDAIITDPPYPEVKRPYGTLTVEQWHDMMDSVVSQAKRLLKPLGSAVFILQPNSEHVGKMRLWLWDFLVRTAKDWNLIQDVYWWNKSALPTVHCHRTRGLMRPSVKYCLWFGAADCYRDQAAVLLPVSDGLKKKTKTYTETRPSGYSVRDARMRDTAIERGGTTPFNLIALANTDSSNKQGERHHGARTPYRLCEWWTRYLTRPGDTILDPFSGSGTFGVAAVRHGRSYIGIDRVKTYCDVAQARLSPRLRPDSPDHSKPLTPK